MSAIHFLPQVSINFSIPYMEMIRSLHAIQETQVQSLGWENPQEKEILQYSCLENPMDGETWWAAVHGVDRSRTRLSDFTLTFHFHALKEEMATHSSVLAWRIPWTEEPDGLPSMGLHRVRHD